MADVAYDRIGRGYANTRRADPRIAARIEAALGDARSVLNVGAGAGSYESADRKVTAVEPSAEMIAQRPSGSAPAVQASAEALPFENGSFDAATAIVTDHHWSDRAAGLREMLRVARHRVLILNADPGLAESFWLTRDYLPGFLDLIPEQYRCTGYWEEELRGLLGTMDVRPVPVPHDCRDGFYQAYWRRPRAYLDQKVRSSISVFHQLLEAEVSTAIEQLRNDLGDGSWEKRHGHLHEERELDVGLRLIVSELDRRV
ncbi:MAG: class I SAM-dependent methyltransferase [Solirubrobacterales bacterium]|nr:class I SAM-dependent methyltransferase [Solirubrobacterales bacterium]